MVAPILGRGSNSQTTTIFQRSCRKPTQQEAKHSSCSRTGVWLPCEAETSGRFVFVSRCGSAGLPGFCQLPALYSIYIAFCKPCLHEAGACPHRQGAAVLGHICEQKAAWTDQYPKYPEADQPLSVTSKCRMTPASDIAPELSCLHACPCRERCMAHAASQWELSPLFFV